jgi:hypothetical protein
MTRDPKTRKMGLPDGYCSPAGHRDGSTRGYAGGGHRIGHNRNTGGAESGAGDETTRDIAGHVSKQMLKNYSRIRMEAKRRALATIVAKKADAKPADENTPWSPQRRCSGHRAPRSTGHCGATQLKVG